jgi:hypothetical protein
MSSEEIEVGDLVRLEDDEDFTIGIGIVLEIEAGTQDALENFFGPIEANHHDENDFNFVDKNLYLHKPVYLVLWSGDKNYFSDDISPRPLWFFKNELKLVNKASKN